MAMMLGRIEELEASLTAAAAFNSLRGQILVKLKHPGSGDERLFTRRR
jgi:hypothetical protein